MDGPESERKRKQSQVLQNVGFVGGRAPNAEIGSGCSRACVPSRTLTALRAQALECWQGRMTSEEEGVWVGRGLAPKQSAGQEVPGALSPGWRGSE